MSTETSTNQVKPLRLTEGETEMLMKALMAASSTEPSSGLTDTQFIRLRLNDEAQPVANAERKENMVF